MDNMRFFHHQSFLLLIVLALCLFLSANCLSISYADNIPSSTEKAILEIKNSNKSDVHENRFAAYKILVGEATHNPDSNAPNKYLLVNLKLNEAYASIIRLYSEFSTCTSDSDIINMINSWDDEPYPSSVDKTGNFARYLADNIPNDSYDGICDSTGKIENLDTGYYLVVDLELPIANAKSSHILTNVFNVDDETYKNTITIKADVPSINKYITTVDQNETYVERAKAVNLYQLYQYKIDISLPDNIIAYDKYYLALKDSMDKGINIISDSSHPIECFLNLSDIDSEKDKNVSRMDSKYYNIVYDNTATTKNTLDITFNNLLAIENTNNFNTITITYWSYLDDAAVIGTEGNQNTVYIEYSSNPNKSSNTPPLDEEKSQSIPVSASVYTCGLHLIKTNPEGDPLPKAKFKLRHEIYTDEEYYDKDNNNNTDINIGFEYAVIDENGYFVKWSVYEEATIVSDDDGYIWIKGLEPGYYELCEIKAPEGYCLPPEDYRIVINWYAPEEYPASPICDYDIKLNFTTTNVSICKHSNKDNYYDIQIINNPEFILPGAGLSETGVLSLIGCVIILSSTIIYIRRKILSTHQEH